MKIHDIVRTCEVSLVLWNPIRWQTQTATALRNLNIIVNKHNFRKNTQLSNVRNDALYMAKRQTAITRNISQDKCLSSRDYCSYSMFGGAGFDAEMCTSPTTVLCHNFVEIAFHIFDVTTAGIVKCDFSHWEGQCCLSAERSSDVHMTSQHTNR